MTPLQRLKQPRMPSLRLHDDVGNASTLQRAGCSLFRCYRLAEARQRCKAVISAFIFETGI
jgi:hypothetical protein